MEDSKHEEIVSALRAKVARLTAERDKWQRRFEEKEKPTRVLGEELARLSSHLCSERYETARLRKELSSINSLLPAGFYPDLSPLERIDMIVANRQAHIDISKTAQTERDSALASRDALAVQVAAAWDALKTIADTAEISGKPPFIHPEVEFTNIARWARAALALTPASPDEPKEPYELFDEFTSRMRSELDANAHKGDWTKWRPTREEAVADLEHHVAKLKAVIIGNGFWQPGQEYAADVANIAMKIYEILLPNNPVKFNPNKFEQL